MDDFKQNAPVPDTVQIAPINMAMFAEARGSLEIARCLTIDGPEMYGVAADQLKDIKALAARLDADRKKITKPLDEAKAAVMDLFRGPVQFCADAEAVIKQSMLTYDNEQRRIAAAAERKAREEQEAERRRIAEAARKQAEAEAEALRRQAEERAAAEREAAEKRAAEAKARGDAEAEQRERFNAQRRADEAREAAEAEAQRRTAEIEQAAQMEQEQVAIFAPPVEKAKADGVSYRENWKAEVTDLEAVITAAAAGNTLARALLTVDSKVLGQQAKSLKANLKVPGIKVFSERTVAARA